VGCDEWLSSSLDSSLNRLGEQASDLLFLVMRDMYTCIDKGARDAHHNDQPKDFGKKVMPHYALD
jgi:hypothetical protein